jgi:hypothetical protein
MSSVRNVRAFTLRELIVPARELTARMAVPRGAGI